MEFTTESIFQALKSPLAVVDSPERRTQLEDYVDAARLPLERSVFDLLSQFAEAVDTEVSSHYQVALSYRPGVLDLQVWAREPAEQQEEAWSLAEGEVEKITLRIPAELKDLASEAAARSGLSVNSWFVRVLASALRRAEEPEERHRRRGRRGQRLTGWVGPETS